MPDLVPERQIYADTIAWGDVTGAVGDSVTVLPIVVAIGVLTDLSVAVMLLWFGVLQVASGIYYGFPMSVEPMKALAGLLIAGSLTTGEFLVAGLLAGGILLVIGLTDTLEWLTGYLGDRVVRGIQFAVALLLLQAGTGLALTNYVLTAAAVVVVGVLVVLDHGKVSALVVLVLGAGIAFTKTGVPSLTVPSVAVAPHISTAGVTERMASATVGQLAMTIGNAAVATALLAQDYYDRSVRPDDLSSSMGVMNLVAVPLGGIPMCHGSGGLAGKYAFGARTATANVILGVAYVALAVAAVGLVMAFPTSILGVILVLVALQLGWTSLDQTSDYLFVVSIGVIGIMHIGLAFATAIVLHQLLRRYDGTN